MYNMQVKILGMSLRLEVIIISGIVGMILGSHLLCSCVTSKGKAIAKEGMRNLLNPSGLRYKMGRGVKGSWETRNIPVEKQQLDTHTGPVVPLPPGQLFFFANNKFSPDCCIPPSSNVSSSDGCACITQAQVNYINARGGNRLPGQEF